MTTMRGRLFLLGMGPGAPEWTTPAVREAVGRCPQLFGGSRMRECAKGMAVPSACWHDLDGRIAELPGRLETALSEGDVAVLASGDVGAFSIAGWLRREMSRRLPELRIENLPGISSVQYFCAHLGLNWTEATLISLHGREDSDWLGRLEHARFSILLTDNGEHRPEAVLRTLVNHGHGGDRAVLGEMLSYPEERWLEGTVAELLEQAEKGLVFREFQIIGIFPSETSAAKEGKTRPFVYYPGLPDEAFIRGERPMTKREVRAQIMSLLELPQQGIFWDVGSGTGSVSVEMALASPLATVIAIEQDPRGVELTRQNGERFGLGNLRLAEGRAEALLASLPIPDRVFIGGSEGALGDILQHLARVCSRGCRVVLTSVTLETPEEALRELAAAGFEERDLLQLQVCRYRKAGNRHLAQAQNPILLIAAELPAKTGTLQEAHSELLAEREQNVNQEMAAEESAELLPRKGHNA